MIELDANDAIARLLYGDVFFFGDRDYAAAAAEYQKALAIDATNSTAHLFSANALMRLNRADEARADIVAALSYNPVYENLYKILDTQPDAFGLRPPARHRFDPPIDGISNQHGFVAAQNDFVDIALTEHTAALSRLKYAARVKGKQ